MSPSSRHGPPSGGKRDRPGSRDQSPFRPDAAVRKAPSIHEIETTVPGTGSPAAIPASDIQTTVEVRPADLAAAAMGPQRAAKHEAPKPAEEPPRLRASETEPTDPAAAVSPQRSTKPFVRDAQKPAEEPARPRAAESGPTDPALRDLAGRIYELKAIVEATAVERRELLEEAKAVNRNFQKLLDKAIAERDSLAKELNESRGQYANDARRQAQAFTELQRDLERERREVERKLREAEEKALKADERAVELDKRLTQALAARDRVAARVQQVENNLESTILPMREDLDRARAAEAKARIELEGARREIAALKLLTGPPPR